MVLWLAAALLCAATDDSVPRVKQEIVVVADRAPTAREDVTSAATVCDAARLSATPSRSAGDFLVLTPGFSVFGAGGTAPVTVAARGFYGGGEVEYVQLRVDGIAQGDPESGLAPWQDIRAEEVARMEIARGVVSPLYGDTAVGGVIDLFTRDRSTDDWSLLLGGGSYGAADAMVSGAHDLARGSLSFSASTQTARAGQPHDGAHRNSARVRWNGAAGAARLLTVTVERRASNRDDAGPVPLADLDQHYSDPLYRFDGEQVARTTGAVALDAVSWSGSLHAQKKSGDRVRTVVLFPPSTADRSFRRLDSDDVGMSLQTTRENGRGGLRGGIDLTAQSYSASYSDVAGDGSAAAPLGSTSANRDVAAAWGGAHFDAGHSLLLTAGLRYDTIRNRHAGASTTDTAWSPRLAVRFGGFYVSSGRGFKAPTIEQLFDVMPLRAFGQTFTLANPSLVPQRVHSAEAGWSRAMAPGLVQVDAYRMRVAQEIDFDARTFRYGNISRSEHRGVELLFEPPATRTLVPRLTAQWTRVMSLDDPARAQLKNVPEYGATAMVTALLPRRISVTALAVWNGGRWFDDAEAVAAPDTRALSLRVERPLGAALLRFDVTNLTASANAAYGFTLRDVRGRLFAYATPDARRSARISVQFNHRGKEGR